MTRESHASPFLRNLKIAGYCGLAAVVLALFVAMCAILKESSLERDAVRHPGETPELHEAGDSTSASTESTKTPG
ncbi:hypothetical protein CH72_5026 [Burkholderia ambifaria AMMD]|uniref:Uncharacterized protein n=1 Tax=Burkholderia ambifaria (strain ATCC BAA-244 / DSM 16087 / CCUG 44356 / LMG 19182 / AMMD) TaxID=339670 RepID=Q0B5N9_BURCM|nr:hypothetical protein [Burkholderia ambifaria]ABI90534.1 conserved hypothetical protein [Burkholderia ambifaria AMMD]AJY23661.1 hypothetical protein CH72_5026 [Burkholderia ambifaria AMMD]MBR7931690.1 hypothetical protein [Burkholderia ambifaria]PEH69694.1 hypothetical protein CRM91_11745 [Burkholderia ambifaria]QQC06850.1 hypothetical protein I6H84_27005 [Burkholderia ambifaria]